MECTDTRLPVWNLKVCLTSVREARDRISCGVKSDNAATHPELNQTLVLYCYGD